MRIKCAAIRYDGKIYEGPAHCVIGLRMVNDGLCSRYPSGDDQGFVTECGKYVGRRAAMVIAVGAGQVTQGETVHGTQLFSEDLRDPGALPGWEDELERHNQQKGHKNE